MNKETQLLAMLDNVFGFPNKFRSNFRKVSQSFDQQTNEHVILIEYRVRVKGTMTSQPRQNAQQQNQQQQQMAFLRQLVAQGKTKWQLLPLSLHSPEMSTGSTSIRASGLTDKSPGTRKINWSQSTKLISPRNQWGSTDYGVWDCRWFFWTPKTVVWSWMVLWSCWECLWRVPVLTLSEARDGIGNQPEERWEADRGILMWRQDVVGWPDLHNLVGKLQFYHWTTPA